MKKKERQVVEFDVAFDGSYDYQVKIVPGNPITVAEIHYTSKTDERDDGLLTYGLGVRKRGDKYDWERGCKSALASCFRNHPATSDKLRKAIWCGFFEVMPREKMLKEEAKAEQEPQQSQFVPVFLKAAEYALKSDFVRTNFLDISIWKSSL